MLMLTINNVKDYETTKLMLIYFATFIRGQYQLSSLLTQMQ
jgi:hypothetical protein